VHAAKVLKEQGWSRIDHNLLWRRFPATWKDAWVAAVRDSSSDQAETTQSVYAVTTFDRASGFANVTFQPKTLIARPQYHKQRPKARKPALAHRHVASPPVSGFDQRICPVTYHFPHLQSANQTFDEVSAFILAAQRR